MVDLSRSRSQKRFPKLTGYLNVVVEKRVLRQNVLSSILGVASVAAIVPSVLFLTWLQTHGIGPTVLAGALALPVSILVWALADRKIRQPKSPQEQKRMEAWRAAAQLSSLAKQHRLHKRLDPTISQLLEAAAFHYERITTSLSGAYWSGESLPAHWRSVKSQAQEAADQAMEELILLAAPCVGDPQSDKGKVLKEAVEDLFELDIGEAISGFRDLANADWTRFAHHSPYAAQSFESGRSVAERLKRLADEIERKGVEVASETGALVSVTTASDSIDIVLNEIATVREAEGELRERI